jgi:hypothetical protein
MKWFWKRPGHPHESLCLLASGSLPEPEARALQTHLVDCAGCRRYFEEIRTVASPLAGWEKQYDGVELNPVVQQRWFQAIESVAEMPPAPTDHSMAIRILLKAWFELIWPSRRVWTGLAIVWVALAIFEFTQSGGRVSLIAQSNAPATDARLAFQDQQRLLVEILGRPPSVAPTEPPRRSPQPRRERPTGWRSAAVRDEIAGFKSQWS